MPRRSPSKLRKRGACRDATPRQPQTAITLQDIQDHQAEADEDLYVPAAWTDYATTTPAGIFGGR